MDRSKWIQWGAKQANKGNKIRKRRCWKIWMVLECEIGGFYAIISLTKCLKNL